MKFKIAIVGRPNVGKSTLFNRLTGKRLAIVHDRPGVTRDRREGEVDFGGLSFTVVDTAGFEESKEGTLQYSMFVQTEKAIADSVAVIFMFDARVGITPADEFFAGMVRKSGKPVIVVANKCESSSASQSGIIEALKLGLGEPVEVSAEHGLGITDLFTAILPFVKDDKDIAETNTKESEEDSEKPQILKLAIVGRPNVGKSTLINALIKNERMLTGPEAGVTRDAIEVDWQWKGQPIKLIDTAGLRKSARVEDHVEKLSVNSAFKAVDFAHVVVLVLSADEVLDKQDLTIARKVTDEGKALIIAVNKWDAVKDKKESMDRLKDKLQTSFAQVQGVLFVKVSALKNRGLEELMSSVFNIYKIWNKRVSTSQLNRWFEKMIEEHQPPRGKHGRQIKLRYITQVAARPPTFTVFSSNPEDLPESYSRYLVNGLRNDFGLKGVPIRIFFRKGNNPYSK